MLKNLTKMSNFVVEPGCHGQVLLCRTLPWECASQKSVARVFVWWKWGDGAALGTPTAACRWVGGMCNRAAALKRPPLRAQCQDTCTAPICSTLCSTASVSSSTKRTEAVKLKGSGGRMQASGEDPPNQYSQNEKYRLSCLKALPYVFAALLLRYLCYTAPLRSGDITR